MKHTLKTLLHFAFFLSLSGCASCAVSSDIPFSRLESPEIQKHMKIKFDGTTAKQASAVFIPEGDDDVIPNTADPGIVVDHELGGSIGLGIYDQFEAVVRMPGELILKWQLLGDRRADAKAGNFSLTPMVGIDATNQTETRKPIFSTDTFTVKTDEFFWDVGVILGYRPINLILLYGGVNHIDSRITGSYQKTTSSNVTTSSPLNGNMVLDAAHFGIEVGTQVALKLEAQVGNLKYQQRDAKRLYGATFALSFYQF